MILFTCPKCDGEIDALAMEKWGDGHQKTVLAPYVCSWCGSLLIFNLELHKLYDPEELTCRLDIDVLALMQKNTAMWSAITQARDLILSLPNRRPVLR